MLGATGVVLGDIGTSPLYAFRESVIGQHRLPLDKLHVLGVLSKLIVTACPTIESSNWPAG